MSEHRSAAEAGVERLAPRDAAVAIRSIPRRFREALAQLDPDDDPRAWRAAVEHAVQAGDVMDTAAGHLRRALVEVRPELREPTDTRADLDRTGDAMAIVAELQRVADRLARTIDSADAGDWLRPAVLKGTEVTALDLVRQAVQQCVQHLREAEQAVARTKEEDVK